MGNTPSIPSPQAPPPPPPVPVCDLECQRQKQLAELKLALDSAKDPESREKARVAYYTLLYGQSWLVKEKQRIAKQDVEPILSKYRIDYEALKGEQKTQSMFKNLEDALKAQEMADEQSGGFLKKQLTAEKDQALVMDRLNALGTPAQPPTNWLGILMDIIITILGLIVLYLLFSKFSTIMSLFGYQTEVVESSV